MLQRGLGAAVVILAFLTIFQFAALRRMRLEIATLRAQVMALSSEPRREEIGRAGAWLHAWLQTSDGGFRSGGLCPAGAPDIDLIGRLLFDTYLNVRAAGGSETEAREAVLQRARAAR